MKTKKTIAEKVVEKYKPSSTIRWLWMIDVCFAIFAIAFLYVVGYGKLLQYWDNFVAFFLGA